jgi:hypothetical protein
MSRTPAKVTQPDIVRALKAAAIAGLSVQRVEIDKTTGRIILFAGAETVPGDDIDRELAEFEALHGQG